MPSAGTKRKQLTAWLAEHGPELLDPAVEARIAAALAPISARYLRDLLRNCGVPLHPLVEGVRQGTVEDVERTLTALSGLYVSARDAGDRATAQECRRLVIEAKEHARWALRRAGGTGERAEWIEWMLVWLENPEVFPVWVRLRKAKRQDAP